MNTPIHFGDDPDGKNRSILLFTIPLLCRSATAI